MLDDPSPYNELELANAMERADEKRGTEEGDKMNYNIYERENQTYVLHNEPLCITPVSLFIDQYSFGYVDFEDPTLRVFMPRESLTNTKNMEPCQVDRMERFVYMDFYIRPEKRKDISKAKTEFERAQMLEGAAVIKGKIPEVGDRIILFRPNVHKLDRSTPIQITTWVQNVSVGLCTISKRKTDKDFIRRNLKERNFGTVLLEVDADSTPGRYGSLVKPPRLPKRVRPSPFPI